MKTNQELNALLKQTDGSGPFSCTSMELLPNGIFVLTIDVPGKVNLLSKKTLQEIDRRLNQIESLINDEDAAGSGLIIRSGKSANFIAGADVHEIDALQEQSIADAFAAAEYGKKVLGRLGMRGIHIPTLAAIHGSCQGGGMELALWCDYRIATDDPATHLGLPEVKLGILPGFGGCILLPRAIGDTLKAVEFISRGESVGAKDALAKGLIHEVVSQDQLMSRAQEVLMTGVWVASTDSSQAADEHEESEIASVRQFANMDWRQRIKDVGVLLLRNYSGQMGRDRFAQGVVSEVKRKSKGYIAPLKAAEVIMRSAELPFPEALRNESVVFAELAMSQASQNMVDIFQDKSRAKQFPQGVSPHAVSTLGVVGAGVMGREIAFEAIVSKAFAKVVLVDIFEKSLEQAVLEISNLIDGRIREGKLRLDDKPALIAKLLTSTEYVDLCQCDAIIEAVRETVQDKMECYRKIESAFDANGGKQLWLFTNTSALSLSDNLRNKQRFAGLHFFNPVSKMGLVEVGKSANSCPEAVATAMDIAVKLGKLPIVCKDNPGFVVNRILAPYILTTSWLLSKGVSPHLIDKAMLDLGMPMGPVTLLDQVGLDVISSVSDSMFSAYGQRMSRPSAETDFVSWLISKGQLGKKSGAGIYLWDKGNIVRDAKTRLPKVNPQLAKQFSGMGNLNMAVESVQEYLVLAIVNEAVRVLADGVVDEPNLIDLAFVFATGFPPSLGGPIRYADQRGVRTLFELSEDLSLACSDEPFRANYRGCAHFAEHSSSRDNFYK
jgi:3-hydroxyacyl-CoA dehydrogenase/enoyl-CoA hydratase/3-hydroxybutyryl-CoA epimerase